ncbi:MAG: M1 family metallopeptidase [Pyrinomonadaceae bacterium]|nr:M1 family metallopeptidase [Pyrinomonadaceae bacterium]
MKIKIFIGLLLLNCAFVFGQTQTTETTLNPAIFQDSGALQKRAIRKNIPLTNSILKAYRAGTRDTSGRPGANYWQLKTDFSINANLNPDTQTITGSETITLYNNSPDKLDRIVLRLDHNIFRPRVPRGFSVPAETTDGMVVTRIKINGTEVDLKFSPQRQGGRPGQQGPQKIEKAFVMGLDQTVATVVLANPIEPKSVATIEIDWNTKLPGGDTGQGHRMTQRWESKLFQPTQWYPRLAKYDDLRGWDNNVYLGPSEFYNNYGKFDVRIEVPAGWIVSGTGVLQNADEALAPFVRERLASALKTDEEIMIVKEDERGVGKALLPRDKNVWHFVADEVNDFAWASSNQFVWRTTRANIPNKGYVPVHMFYLPERANLFAQAGKNARHALEFYSKYLIPYAFPQLTLQDGPSAGMEYPMVINSNQGAADHETFHQWIPMMVGTNETRYGWMDEGFNNYSNILSGADANGKPFNIDNIGQSYGRINGNEDEPTMMWNANQAGNLYGFQTYQKVGMMFSMLGGIVGDDAMHAAIKKYVETWKFKHPSPWDFTFFMNKELGRDLNWFWYYWLFTNESVNGSIKSVVAQGEKTKVTVHQAGEMPSPVVLKVEFADGSDKIKAMPNAKMLDDKTAIVKWNEDIWFNGDRDFQATLDFGKRKINKITLDPFGRFPDTDNKDNVWTNR